MSNALAPTLHAPRPDGFEARVAFFATGRSAAPGGPLPELGGALFDAADEGKGLATGATRAARDGARKLGIASLISSVGENNPQSRALCERLGAVDEGIYETPFGPMRKFRHFGEPA